MGTRDVWLVLRARDYASRVVQQVGREFGNLESAQAAAMQRQVAIGSVLTTGGAILTGMGLAGLRAYESMGKAALDYNKEAAATLTQVDQTGVSLEQIKNIGRDVAAAIPAPFKQMQAALFDIFSSMNVNVSEAQTLLTGFAKAAVAGTTDVQTAGRETIAIMNAFQLPVSKLNDVLDFQFQLVRKGVGTYSEFASTIGRVIPNAVKAGQGLNELGGALAFATRNGLSTAMAATAVARAFDVMSKPMVVQRLRAMGIQALNLDGSFKPLSVTLGELSKKLQGMSDIKRIEVLDALFKGQGNNIQARRFLELALRNSDALKGFVADMANSKGALASAYDIMFKQGANQAQLFSNNLEILKTTLGDAVLPVFNVFIAALIQVVQWFNNLSPETKRIIALFGLLFSALLTIVGIGMVFAGALALLGAAAAALGVSLGVLLSGFALIILAVAAVAAGTILLIKHWEEVTAWFQKLVDIFQKGGFNEALKFLGQEFMKLWDTYILPGLQRAYSGIRGWITGTLIPFFQQWAPKLTLALWGWILNNYPVVLGWLGTALSALDNWIMGTAWPTIHAHWTDWLFALWGWAADGGAYVLGLLQIALDALGAWITDTAVPTLTADTSTLAVAFWQWIQASVPEALNQLGIWATVIANWIVTTGGPWLATSLTSLAHSLSDWISNEGIPWTIQHLIEWGIAISNWLLTDGVTWINATSLKLALALTDWITTQGIPFVLTKLPLWSTIIIGYIFGVFIPMLMLAMIQAAIQMVSSLVGGLIGEVPRLFGFFTSLPGRILVALGDTSMTLFIEGSLLLEGLLNGAESAFQTMLAWVALIPGMVVDGIGNIADVLFEIGKQFIEGLKRGMESAWGSVKSWMEERAKDAIEPWRVVFRLFSPSKEMFDIGNFIMMGLQNGLIQGYGPVAAFITLVTNEMVQRFLTARNNAELAMVKTAADITTQAMLTEQQKINNFLTAMAQGVAQKTKEIQDSIAKARIDAAILQQIANNPANSVDVRAAANGVTPGTSITPETSTQFYIYRNGNQELFFGSYADALAEAGPDGLVTPVINGLNDPGTTAAKYRADHPDLYNADGSLKDTTGSTTTTPTDTSGGSSVGSSGGGSFGGGSSSGPTISVVYNITVEGSLLGFEEFDKQLQEKLDKHDEELLKEIELVT